MDQWAENQYSSPESMPRSELAAKAFDIIDYNIQGETAYQLLKTASKEIPEIENYIALRDKKVNDPLFGVTLASMNAITDYLAKTIPASESYFYYLYRELVNKSNFSFNAQDWTQFINSLEKEIETKDSPTKRTLLALAKISQQSNHLAYTDLMQEEDYIKMFELEEEALSVCPLHNEDDSLLKALLYNALGNLKYNSQDEMIAYLVNGETASDFKPHAELIGYTRSYPSNSKDYLIRARDIASRLLNPGHPLFIGMESDILIYDKTVRNLSPSDYENLKKFYDYSEYYFPDSTFEAVTNKLLKYLDGWMMEPENMDPSVAITLLNKFRDYIGYSNPVYLNFMKNLATLLISYDIDADYWNKRLIEDMTNAGIDPSSDEAALAMVSLYANILNNLRFNQPEDIIKKFNDIVKQYLKSHSPTELSINLGNQIGNFLYSYMYDNKKAVEIMDLVIEDVEKMYGKEARKHPDWWKNYIERTNMRIQGYNPKEIDKTYKDLVKTVKTIESPYRDKQLWMVVNSYANYLTNLAETPQPEKALDIMLEYQNLGREIIPYGDFLINSLIAHLMYLTGRNKDRVLPLTLSTLEVADSAFRNGDALRLSYADFVWPVNTLIELGEFENALRAVDLQLEVYNLDNNGQFSLDYFNDAVTKAKILDALNRKNEARRLMAECIQQLNMIPGITSSPYLLDLLWEDYYLTSTGSQDDLMMVMAKLKIICAKTMELRELYPDDENLFSYLVRGLSEVWNVISAARGYLNRYKNSEDSDSASQIIELIESSMVNSGLFNVSLTIKDEFPSHTPNYKTDPYYIGLNMSMARYYNSTGDWSQAFELYEEILSSNVDIDTRLSVLSGLINIASDQNLFNLFGKYLDEYEQILDSVAYCSDNERMLLDSYGATYNIKMENYEKSYDYARDFYNISRKVLDNNFQLMTTAEQDSYMESYGDPSSFLGNLLELKDDKNVDEIYDAVIYKTGMQLRSQKATTEAIRNIKDPEILNLLDSIQILNKQKLQLTSGKTWNPNSSSDNNFFKMAELQRLINYMEGKVLDATVSLRNEEIKDIKWQEIQNRLKENEAAIEFVYTFKSVFALILRPGFEKPKAIRLTSQDELWNLVKSQNKKNSAALAKTLYKNNANTLYKMLWQPLEDELKGVENVYYHLPGILNTLAFNTFQSDSGEYLFDKYNLHQLTTTGQLVFDEEYSVPESLVVMGNILYGKTQNPARKSEAAQRGIDDDYDLTDQPDERGVARDYFRHLPFTIDEMQNISDLFHEVRIDKTELHDATEGRLRQLVENHPDIIHLATHGFYINSDEAARKVGFYKDKSTSSMMRSGFVLAGAEEAWRGISTEAENNDGIMTAEEVAQLDLKGTSLVTLSACETALGGYNFEGIYGLQRGFKQAGVQSMLVSLWSVNDESTSIFMQEFYKELRDGKTKQEAWRKAVSAVKTKFPEPYYWASFVVLDP